MVCILSSLFLWRQSGDEEREPCVWSTLTDVAVAPFAVPGAKPVNGKSPLAASVDEKTCAAECSADATCAAYTWMAEAGGLGVGGTCWLVADISGSTGARLRKRLFVRPLLKRPSRHMLHARRDELRCMRPRAGEDLLLPPRAMGLHRVRPSKHWPCQQATLLPGARVATAAGAFASALLDHRTRLGRLLAWRDRRARDGCRLPRRD